MLADDFDQWLARARHRTGSDQDFADNTIDHRSKLGIVIESAACDADDIGRNLPVEGEPLSAERRQSNERPVAVIGSTKSVVMGSLLVGWSALV